MMAKLTPYLIGLGAIGVAIFFVFESGRLQMQLANEREQKELFEKSARETSRQLALYYAKHAAITAQRDKLQSEVDRYATDAVACNLTVGAVSLLNAARGYDTAPGTDEESRSASSVTQREEIKHHANCAFQYRELAVRHDSLVDWLLGISNTSGISPCFDGKNWTIPLACYSG